MNVHARERILILGGNGMLGHKLWQVCRDRFDTFVTARGDLGRYPEIFEARRCVSSVAAEDFDGVVRAIASIRPNAVVNCIGVIKQRSEAKDPLTSLMVNSVFPHRLAQLCRASGTRLIHLSTDCVFSGRAGAYTEADVADAEDLYGRTKLLGEVEGPGCLTLRTSMIGRELATSYGLVEWFLGQRGRTVSGYRRAVFSGFTTLALAGIIAGVIEHHPTLDGVWHVAAEPISKLDLLELIRAAYGLEIRIDPDELAVMDRSLNADRFRCATGLMPPSWTEMVVTMARDRTPYDELRRQRA